MPKAIIHNAQTAESKETIYAGARRLIMSFLSLAFVICVLLVMSSAWFSRSKTPKANNANVGVINDTSADFSLYHWNTSLSAWETCNIIQMQNSVPNQTERYMMLSLAPMRTAHINMSAFTTPDDTNSDELFDYIYVKVVETLPNRVVPSDYIPSSPLSKAVEAGSTLPPASYTALTDSDLITHNIADTNYVHSIDCNSSDTVVFDIHISKNVCNYFALWGLEGSVSLT